MAEVILRPDPQAFPSGTTVKVKQLPPTGGRLEGEPGGAAVAEPVVASNGTLVVTGLVEGTRYVGWANVGGKDRYVTFTPGAVTASSPTGGTGVLLTANAGSSLESNEPGKLLRLRAINFDLKTNAEAGKRYVGYEITDAEGHTYFEALTPALETISETFGICAFPGAVPLGVAALGVSSRTVNLPLPDIALPKGWKVNLINVGAKGGDTFPLFRWLYEYVNPPVV